MASLLLSGLLGCGAGARASGSPKIDPRQEPTTEEERDYLQGFAEVFRSWSDLPREQRSQIGPSAFAKRIVVRVNVPVGCVAADPSQRPTSGYLWPDFAQQCIEGTGRTHPPHTLDADAVLESTAWEPWPDPLPFRTMMHVTMGEGGTTIGLAPPVLYCEVTIVDTHWLVVPRGRVSLSLTEGGSYCETSDDP